MDSMSKLPLNRRPVSTLIQHVLVEKAEVDSALLCCLGRDQHSRRPTIQHPGARNVNQSENGLLASYNKALLIAKSGLPFTVGESLVIPAIKEAISTVMERDVAPVIKAIPQSNDTVARLIREMSLDTEQS